MVNQQRAVPSGNQGARQTQRSHYLAGMAHQFTIVLLALILGWSASSTAEVPEPRSPYEITATRIDGEAQSLSQYKGKVLLLVNVASKCGYTPQYEGLEALYKEYKDRGFVVLGFPSNDFGGQEPGANEEIADFCRATWGVEFPMFEKLHVNGPDQHPLYELLTGLPEPLGGDIEWNFQKFLVARDGKVVDRIAPATKPASIKNKIEVLLGEKPASEPTALRP